ncbi:Lrp/AsnC family transcriptional regulator [Marinibaculum pumilum]|uniref:Lrp/AsnC family transcriptional regulator n=1 Tax=Marinibaculum pumilum TaxID=1766165 RepID=A0ABV7L0R0_9PROT
MELTDQDRAILRLLQQDATLTLQALADQVGLSQASVWRRLQGLEKGGAIQGRVALVDPDRVGVPVCVLTSLTIRDHAAETRAAFEAFVKSREEIMECYAVSGSYDYMLMVRVEDVAAYEAFLMNHVLGNPVVASAASAFTLRRLKYTTAVPL